MPLSEDIEHRFAYHPPKGAERVAAHEAVRAQIKAVAHMLDGALPDGREKALAITNLEQAMFWANAAVARQRD
jgi:hypothetical protein